MLLIIFLVFDAKGYLKNTLVTDNLLNGTGRLSHSGDILSQNDPEKGVRKGKFFIGKKPGLLRRAFFFSKI
ncbi:MAG: hypothetical protein EOO06_19255 [Chitinophagaceae bacterium]|nr:MAG: hypothetical protein EOO06_19255 [Chitinophagaceae bacterium]